MIIQVVSFVFKLMSDWLFLVTSSWLLSIFVLFSIIGLVVNLVINSTADKG